MSFFISLLVRWVLALAHLLMIIRIFIHSSAGRAQRAVSLRSERSMSRGFPSLELDTVLEERSDPEQTQVGIKFSLFLYVK